MRLSKEVCKSIDDYIGDKPKISSADLTDFVMSVVPASDYEELHRAYCKGIANRRIRKRKDADGLRGIFSDGSRKDENYINLTTTQNTADVLAVKSNQEKKVEQMLKNIRKANRKYQVLIGQISMDEWLTEIGNERKLV